jgi:hypothetical protein
MNGVTVIRIVERVLAVSVSEPSQTRKGEDQLDLLKAKAEREQQDQERTYPKTKPIIDMTA